MFSFHKPKIYRSLSGCCICRAKSSSSRFTDSKKYEPEFQKCFKIIERRSGEICNACVLLVKRWKKLPSNTTRDWHHVVDARAGPGTKSIKSKLNTINDNLMGSTHPLTQSSNNRKPQTIQRKLLSNNKSKIGSDCNRDLNVVHNQMPSPDASDSSDMDDEIEEDIDDLEDDIEIQTTNKAVESVNSCGNKSNTEANNKRNKDRESPTNAAINSFLDMTFWKKEKICCGVIFKGPDNEVLIYPKLLEPCCCRRKRFDRIEAKLSSIVNTGISDSSSVVSSPLTEDDANSNASSGNISLT